MDSASIILPQNFSRAAHTIVVSDIHLTEAEPPHPGHSLWKRYKRPKFFIDKSFKRFLEFIVEQAEAPIELVLNGDIFDFDSIMTLPEVRDFEISWLEKKRGLNAEEAKSRFKLSVILNDHPVWIEAIREFILRGNRVVFIIGNHDMEFHWSSVQQDFLDALNLPPEKRGLFRFCEWFYISNSDTLIEHGNQYDDYCMSQNPINPLIRKSNKVYVRLPFGNLAGRYIMNGLGLLNPHVDSSYIKARFIEYVHFFIKYVVRNQPLILWSWFWGAVVTLVVSLVEGFEPPLSDPLTMDRRVRDIARKANTTSRVVRALRAIHVHPAIYNPVKILKELWLDRAFLLLILFLFAFYLFSIVNLFAPISFWWFVLIFILVLPFFVFYARSVESDLAKLNKVILNRVGLSSQITRVKRVVMGHTHLQFHKMVDGVEVLNTGTWSPAFEDPECTKSFGKKCFAWIRPSDGMAREAEVFEWLDSGIQKIEWEANPS